jgi:hypothetical protein
MTQNDKNVAMFLTMIAGSVVVLTVFVVAAERISERALAQRAEERVLQKIAAYNEQGVLYVRELPSGKLPSLPALEVAVTPQAITMPLLEQASIEHVRVQGFVSSGMIAWRMAWADPTIDANVDVGRFTDAVALQFPVGKDASFMMGERGKAVQILHWKALWQKDLDEHFQDVQDLHPNYWTDLYWFAEGEFPYPVTASFTKEKSRAWFVAQQAGNPLAQFERPDAVEELMAEGFGSLTHQEADVTEGRGEWKDGLWATVFVRPLATEDPLDHQFARGQRGRFSVAVWEGSAGNVGGRKHWSDWFEFKLEP